MTLELLVPDVCPSDDELFAYALGQHAEAAEESLRSHVVACNRCCEAVAAATRGTVSNESGAREQPEEVSPAALAETLNPGEQLGRYLILEFLGKGAMGAVYSARDPKLDRRVAIKVLRPEAIERAGQKELKARLLREAQAMARLSHPNVVAVHELAEVGGRLFVAMELVEGGTLRSWLAERPRSFDEVLDVFVAAAGGLAAAHRAGIIHRDFKPENVLINADGRALVTDFGLARLTRAPSRGLDDQTPMPLTPRPKDGTSDWVGLIGTPAYMAPEQLAYGEVDARSDLFTWCAALYEALYGVRPFPAVTVAELKERHARGPVRPPPESRAPEWIGELLRRGLRALPSERPASMAALIKEIETARNPIAPPAIKGVARARRIAGIALLAIVAIAIIWLVRARANPNLACVEGARRIDSVWNAERRQQIESAFLGTHLAYAKDAWSRVSPALDRFANAWPAAYLAACTLGVEKPDASTEAYLRMACLSEQLAAVQAKGDLFARADDKLVEDAAAMASAIENPNQCERGLALSAPPPAPALRPAVERVRADLAKIKSLGEAGHFDEARPLEQRALAAAQAMPFRPLQAEALLAQAELASEAYEASASLAGATAAALVAEGSRHDEVAARAWTLALHEAAELSLFDEARNLERQARAAVERIGGDDVLMASLENAVGSMLQSAGKPEEALAAQTSAWAHYQKTGREDRFSSWLLNDEASALEVLGRHAEAADEFQRAVELKLRLLGPGHPDVGLSLVNLASVLTSLGRFAPAKVALDRARAIFEAALTPDHFLYIPLEVNTGDLALATGDPAAALPAYQRGLAAAAKNSMLIHPAARDALLGMGRAQLALGRPADAIASFEQALPPAGSPGDAVQLADIHFGLARALRAAGRDPERVAQLAGSARAAYLASGPRSVQSVSEVDAWFARR